MATVARNETIGTNAPLQAVGGGGWLGGFGNLLRKELGQWWGTRTWWVQMIIWVVMLNGITALIMLTESAMAGAELQQEIVTAFMSMSIVFIAIGTIIAGQGALVGEKELGTAAWVMSKPASRPAFILAKVVAFTAGFWVAAIAIPSALFVVMAGQLADLHVSLLPFLSGVASSRSPSSFTWR